ncbi:MAG: nucleotide exchange factor GrpE [Ardenticatenia bacterium]|nr:nucleotide exchange factor GrpE [Ardenticatenia bacterium]
MDNERDKPVAAEDLEAEVAENVESPEALTAKQEEHDPLAALQSELEKAQAQAAEYLDGWQRARAEFANLKKRVEAEREEIRYRSNEELLLKVLPVVDDFERAFQELPPEMEDAAWVSGITMISNKLHKLLGSENVAPLEAAGKPFDPQWHQAMMQEETEDYPDGICIEEIQRGYRLGDRVLRPALVKVACNSGN